MRVMIIGQKWLAEQLLALCMRRGDDVAAVCVPRTDDRLAAAATEAGIPVCMVAGRTGADWVPDGVDVLLCANLHAFVGADARAKARFGALGYHPSLLPRHRGRDAVRWAIHMRESLTGGTAYWMDDGADTGPIAAQGWCWIRPGDTPEALWRRDLAPMGLELFTQVLAGLDVGHVTSRPQDEALATWEPAWRVSRLAGAG
ncbi:MULTISPECIES: formyltransferase family protein [unclassified Polaromonas]|jgi:methionyl-tRNA formyltransferase|uniref:formyltransferase family protein n=1 Tax=unclassified Polaromonas TaxID=2638319 RepID=UPI000BD6D8EB|nr:MULTISPECIES: formyltransferase family protein [unclassified Polaromonas]OYZ76103.1 MAG: methionyl-tRNA formyltransferase [Polaromonas sp. 24-63-21]OZA47390.1 MAG: methionyl-tRNA formyltransferase [Polaromonas sp. 17-63-33]